MLLHQAWIVRQAETDGVSVSAAVGASARRQVARLEFAGPAELLERILFVSGAFVFVSGGLRTS